MRPRWQTADNCGRTRRQLKRWRALPLPLPLLSRCLCLCRRQQEQSTKTKTIYKNYNQAAKLSTLAYQIEN